MDFCFPTSKASVRVFVFLLVVLVRAFSFCYLSGQCVDFRLPICKVGVWIFVFLLVRLVCGFSSSCL